MSEVIILRTDHYDASLEAFVRDDVLQAEREILVVADEANGRIEVPPAFKKIVADPVRLGLYATPDVMWRCGDYALYEALKVFPRASRFWLIEPDVRIHGANIKSFFDGLGNRGDPDFLTARFVEAGPEWMWHRTMSPFAPRVYLCMMQLCRLSRRAVAHLYAQRLRLGDAFASGDLPAEDWPNDEAFVLSTLAKSGFSFAPLADHATDFSIADTFTFTKPTSARWLESLPKNNCLYHPVAAGAKFLSRARAYLAERALLALDPSEILEEFAQGLLPQVQMECGAERAMVFESEMRKVADWVARRRDMGGGQR